VKDPLGSQTLMKSNAQLRFEEQGKAPQPPPAQDDQHAAASSSQTTPPTSTLRCWICLDYGCLQLYSVGRQLYSAGEK
jgi:hypothetical protein